MNKRRLGGSVIEIAPLALGGNVFGWTIDETTSFEVLDRFVAAGFQLIDTADVYSRWKPGHVGGESETIIGKWQKRRANRDKIIIATKVGMEMDPDRKGLSREHILRSVEQSLVRLQTDYIDLYQSHADDPATAPEETLETYSELVKQGKVRVIGASNFTAERLAQSQAISKQYAWPTYQSLQPCYNLYEREDYETKLEQHCLKAGLGVITYFSLARGFLTGKYRSEIDLAKSPRGKDVKEFLDARGFRILATLDDISAQLNSTPGRVALAWLISRPSITAPIASATSIEHVNDLVSAAHLFLDSAHIEQLNQASAYGATTQSA
ncbi:MAG: aldo/keto reductase [Candidatus Zixiibacteriota bacterium]